MSLPVPLAKVSVRAFAVIPVAILTTLAFLLALLGLPFRSEGRKYVREVILVALSAACALMAGCPMQPPVDQDTEDPTG